MTLRSTLVVATVGASALLGAAHAAGPIGTAGPDRLVGTPRADVIAGREGDDRIDGRGGWDRLHGGSGRDTIRGGPGGDRIAVHLDGSRDTVSCGTGFDTVNAETFDSVGADCELVVRQLSRDTLELFNAQHETQVEPDSFAVGATVVTAFQSGRLYRGGAAGIGWATSTDAGATWRTGFLDRVTERASDPVVGYDAARKTWMIAILAATGTDGGLYVSRSADGLAWSAPQPAAVDPDERYDKEWLACDPWPGSQWFGRCYLSYLDAASSEIRTRYSDDAGRTWSDPVGVRAPGTSSPNGAYPLIRPDGSLLVVFRGVAVGASDTDAILVARSIDGGLRFAPVEVLAERFEEQINGVRAPVLPSADIDASGTAYVVWSDCRFGADCFTNDIVLATSRDGAAWSAPTRVPFPASPELDWFVPGIAVAPRTAGAHARLAVVAYAVTKAYGCGDCETVDAYAITSNDGGRTWAIARRLNAEPMPARWAADTALGRMYADYVSVSFAAGQPVAVVSLAGEPVGDELRQAIVAARLR